MTTYHSEAAKVRDLPRVMQYITGKVLDIGCGPDKITPDAIGVDGRDLPGVDHVFELGEDSKDVIEAILGKHNGEKFDVVFSSHFLEHMMDQYRTVRHWRLAIKPGGYLVLYLPDGNHYDNKENPEHMVDMKYEPFMFWFQRVFCGEGKDFKGNPLKKLFEVVESGMDVGDDRYSFYVVARRV